ncbi:MAG: hypothetical protein K0R55_4328 [Sporomusa sp.]|nr:hypothetical protein [Sporomusa sp.]
MCGELFNKDLIKYLIKYFCNVLEENYGRA